jgi:hypothetical protein
LCTSSARLLLSVVSAAARLVEAPKPGERVSTPSAQLVPLLDLATSSFLPVQRDSEAMAAILLPLLALLPAAQAIPSVLVYTRTAGASRRLPANPSDQSFDFFDKSPSSTSPGSSRANPRF